MKIFVKFSDKMSNRKTESTPCVLLPGTSNLGIGNVMQSASSLVDVESHKTSEVSQTGSFLKILNVCCFFSFTLLLYLNYQ